MAASVKWRVMSSVSDQTFSAELTASAAREASWDADAVIAFLGAVEARSGQVWERPVHFPAPFLLGAGAALRLASWEHAGIHPHRAAGLPDAREVFQQVAGWCLHSPTVERDELVRVLCVKVLEISITQLAWHAPELMGASVLLEEVDDEDTLLNVIAQIAWKHRQKEPHYDAS